MQLPADAKETNYLSVLELEGSASFHEIDKAFCREVANAGQRAKVGSSAEDLHEFLRVRLDAYIVLTTPVLRRQWEPYFDLRPAGPRSLDELRHDVVMLAHRWQRENPTGAKIGADNLTSSMNDLRALSQVLRQEVEGARTNGPTYLQTLVVGRGNSPAGRAGLSAVLTEAWAQQETARFQNSTGFSAHAATKARERADQQLEALFKKFELGGLPDCDWTVGD